jgi:hypothetical protein
MPDRRARKFSPGAFEGQDARLPTGQRGERVAGGEALAAVERKGDLETGVDQTSGFEERGDARQDAVGARLDPRPAGLGEGAAGEIAVAGQVLGERAGGRLAGRGAQRAWAEAGGHGRRAA